MGPQLGSRFQNFLIFSIFFLRKFFSKGKFFFSKVVHLTIKMISILTLSQKRKFQLFRDPNCGPTVGCGPHTLMNPERNDQSEIFVQLVGPLSTELLFSSAESKAV